MTNYNERLDEIFNTLPVHGIISSDGIRDDYWDAVNARTKLKQAITSLIKELVAEAKPEKKPDYIEAHDNDGHRYQIPWQKREDWYKWCEIPSDDERSWDTPEYAIRIDGMSVTDNRGYNKAIKEFEQNLLKALEER